MAEHSPGVSRSGTSILCSITPNTRHDNRQSNRILAIHSTMSPQEIRIGNLVTHKGSTYTVVSISGISYSFKKMDVTIMETGGDRKWICVDINTINPIPITEEWLIKFGFSQTRHAWIYELFGFKYHVRAKRFKVCNGYWINIDVVHKLQNLYFELTKEELL